MFTVMAEKINMTRKKIKEEVWNRNADYITKVAKDQTEAGATHIDVNAGGDPSKEVEDMKWLTEIVSKATELPLVFDSTNPEAIESGIAICNRAGTIINSITGEKDRIEKILPLVVKYNTGVVALSMDDRGMPENYEGRVENAENLVKILKDNNISLDRVYFDFLARPASTNPGQAKDVLNAIKYIKSKYPETHITLGLSNISFGIPKRNNLNKAFLAMLIAYGCDGAVMDPCEKGMMGMLYSARAAIGEDMYCMEYLTAFREGKLS